MSQDNLIKLDCSECKRRNYYQYKNKRLPKLEKSKYCKFCNKHTPHKESK